MGELPISISKLNDFIFCPVSIYFHTLDCETNDIAIKDSYQLNGTHTHKKIDTSTYSTSKNILQGVSVYSEKYNLYGKIDIFDAVKGILTERKKKIKNIYDGYILQLYAQYYALLEMGYKVCSLRLYSMDDNKIYKVVLPEENPEMFNKFQDLLFQIDTFQFDNFHQKNKSKCERCIYEPLCSYSLLSKEVRQ